MGFWFIDDLFLEPKLLLETISEEGLPDLRAIRIDIFHDLGAFTSIDQCHISIAHILKNGWTKNTAF